MQIQRRAQLAMTTYYDKLTNRTLIVRPEPFVLDNVFTDEQFDELKSRISSMCDENVIPYESAFGRYAVNPNDKIISPLAEYHELALLRARNIFSKTLLPTYCLWVSYQGFRARLPRHVDDNACTYTIDLCVSRKTQWPIYIESQEFLLEPNQAVCYYGEDQYHWRESFPDPANNEVQMIFFHFAEPEHWFFTKGPSHMHEVTRIRHEYQVREGLREA